MNSIKIEIIKKIEDIREIWKSLDDKIHFELGYDWYKNNQGVLSEETLYFTMFDKDKIIMIVPVHLVSKEIIWAFNNPIKFINGTNYNLDIELDHPGNEFKYLLITSPFGFKSDFINIDNFEAKDRKRYTEVMLNEIINFKKQENYDDIFFLYLNKLGSLQNELLNRRYKTIPIIFDCVANCKYLNFDEYLNSEIESPKQRREIRREIKAFYNAGFKIEIVNEFSNIADKLAYLEGELLVKYGYGKEVDLFYSKNWYKKLDKTYGEQSKVFIVKNEIEEIVGFSLFIFDRDMQSMSAKATGFDYSKIFKNSYCYFNIVYYEPINYAIENKIKRISFGCEMYDVKRKRGCKFEEYYLTFQDEYRKIFKNKERYDLARSMYQNYLEQFIK